jgi:uncharacterized protein GlcG (DUF336 family)
MSPLHIGINSTIALRQTTSIRFISGHRRTPQWVEPIPSFNPAAATPVVVCVWWQKRIQEIHMSKATLSLDLADARRIIAAGERKATEIGVPYNIAVADAGGGLVAHVRMDGAWLGSVDIAINKSWTARAFDMSTDDLSHLAQSGQQGFGINTTNGSRVVIFGGGIPVKRDGVVIGAVGASGGSVEQDIEIAKAAVIGFAG